MDQDHKLRNRGVWGVTRTSSHDSSLLLPLAGETTPLGSSSSHNRPRPTRTFSSSNWSHKPDNSATSFYRRVALLLFMAVAALSYHGFETSRRAARLQRDLDSESEVLGTLHKQIASFEQENKKLLRELQLAEQQVRNLEKNEDEAEAQKLEAKVVHLTKLRQSTQTLIQQYSLRVLLQRFGPGPHRVEVQLEFDPDSNVAEEPGGDKFIIEMAPESEMPHAVHWFLEQVEQGLYNGASFHRNAHHVIQAGLVPNFATPPDLQLAQSMRQSGLANVLFQEYSHDFPHVKWTLGYAGRPGGPDFYISMQDNVKNHGPGPQGLFDEPSEADPCFAKVVDGFDAVERMHKSALKAGDNSRMERFVAIRYMRLLRQEEEEVQERREEEERQEEEERREEDGRQEEENRVENEEVREEERVIE